MTGQKTEETMTFNSRGFIATWRVMLLLLPLVARNPLTSGQNHSLTRTGTPDNQMTTQLVSSLNELSEGLDITPLTTADVNPTEIAGKTQTPGMTPVTAQPAATTTPIYALLSGWNTTEDKTTVRSSTGKARTSQDHTSTKPTMTSPLLSDSSQSADTVSTSGSMRDKTPDVSTYPSQFTKTMGTPTEEDKSDSTSLSTGSGGRVVTSTASHKTSAATPFIRTTKAKNKQDSTKAETKPKQGSNPGNAVAAIIGGALLLMMVGFVGIYMKKRKIQKQQITTTDWAGPSPFLEAGSNDDQTTKRSSNRISLNSFLPQRLSKRLSLLPETDEELEDMTPGITFGGNHQENSVGQKLEGDEVQESNGTSAVVQENKTKGDYVEAGENIVSQTSLQTNNSPSTNNSSAT